MLEPVEVERVIGRATVLAVFPASKLGRVAGCRVTEGELHRNAKVRLYRGTDLVFEGEMASCGMKEDVHEIGWLNVASASRASRISRSGRSSATPWKSGKPA
jgi:translation initiation factor IF-2